MNTPKSETPEVDALLDEHGKLLSNTLKYPTEQALIGLSRKLERERDNLKTNNEGLCVAIGNFDAAIRRIAVALTGKACGGIDTGHEINPETGEPYGHGGHTGWLLAEEAKKLVRERDRLRQELSGRASVRNLTIIGWMDGHEFIGLPEEAEKHPNAIPVFTVQPKMTAAELYTSFGYALAVRVLQSDLYPLLDDRERAECDALVSGRAAVQLQQPLTTDELLEVIKLIDKAIYRITHGLAPMRIPVDPSDPDVVLAQCKSIILSMPCMTAVAVDVQPQSTEKDAELIRMCNYMLSCDGEDDVTLPDDYIPVARALLSRLTK